MWRDIAYTNTEAVQAALQALSEAPTVLPSFLDGQDPLSELARQYLATYQHRENVVLNMMFHNVEVLPGLSPYTKSEAKCREYLEQLKIFFSFCNQENFTSVGLGDLHGIYRKQQ